MKLISSLQLIFLLLSESHAPAQVQKLDKDLVQQHTTYFIIEDEEIRGADDLLSEIGKAQFLAMGEIHGSEQLSKFTESILIEAKKSGYDNFALEVGPYSAEKLEDLIGSGPDAVTEFYKKYSSKLFGIYPIPFFTNNSDLRFLKTADSLDYDLWGLDQEFAFSTIYLLDELVKKNPVPLTKPQKKMLSKLKSRLSWWYKRGQLFSGFPLSCRTQEDQTFQRFLSSFEDNSQLRDIINDLKESLQIYCMAEKGQGKDSNLRRVTYFYKNFTENLKEAKDSGEEPKVIPKMGSYHMGREASPANVYDLGNYVQKIAKQNDSNSLHLRFLNRYFGGGEDKVEDKDWSSSVNFISVGKKDQWALIDVRDLRKDIQSEKILATAFEKREILNYDYILIMPEDDRKDKHY